MVCSFNFNEQQNKSILSLENTVTLEIRLTCSLVWHLLKENDQLSPTEKVNLFDIVSMNLIFTFSLIK
jgi:hypothetical protein